MSVDPMVASTMSPYAYVASNPLNATDRTGNGAFDDVFDLILHALMPSFCPTNDDIEGGTIRASRHECG